MSIGNPGKVGLISYVYTNNDWGISRNNLDGSNNDKSQDWVLYHGTVFYVFWNWLDGVGYSPYTIYVPMHGMQNSNWEIISVGDWGAPESNTVWNLLWNNAKRVTDFNCSTYGLCKNNGSYYNLRISCDYVNSSIQQSGIHLVAGADRPVFGYGNAVGLSSDLDGDGWFHLSTDGWINGNGVFNSCSGLYASLYVFTHPSNYIINTY